MRHRSAVFFTRLAHFVTHVEQVGDDVVQVVVTQRAGS